MNVLIDGQVLATGEVRRGIGHAFLAIASRLAKYDVGTRYHITVFDTGHLDAFDAEARARLHPIVVPVPDPALSPATRAQHYTDFLALYARVTDARVTWIPNPLMPNVMLPQVARCGRVVVTLYDLIPQVLPAMYLDRWPAVIRDDYLARLASLAQHATHIVAISESTAADFRRYAPQAADRVTSVALAADTDAYMPLACPLGRDSEGRRTILYTGGFDPRKNMARAVEAFAALRARHGVAVADTHLVVVCAATPADREGFDVLCRSLGVDAHVTLTGYVETSELVHRTQRASVVFFPSLYEGFGLPVAEALACGTPVVALARSAIPEVGGGVVHYAADDTAEAFANALQAALCPAAHAPAARAQRIEQARRFSWDETARRYEDILRDAARRSSRVPRRRPKVAMATPWPPQASGIANYARELAAELGKLVDLTIVSDQPEAVDASAWPVIAAADYADRAGEYDAGIYHIGNNETFHYWNYPLAWDYPGIAVIHDTNLHAFLEATFFGRPGDKYYRDTIVMAHGEEGNSAYDHHKAGRGIPNLWRFPMSPGLAKRSRATIVHSAYAGSEMAIAHNVHVVPLCTVVTDGAPTHEDFTLRDRFSIPADRFLVATFGFVNFLKRVSTALDAVKRLVDAGWPVHFVIAGRLVSPELGIEAQIERLGLLRHVTVTDYVSDADFDAWMRLADVVVSLRCPTMGESSAALLRAFGMGKACIVSDYRQFAEFPASICAKVAPDTDHEVEEIVTAITRLLESLAQRRVMGGRAQEYARHHASFAGAAHRYLNIIHGLMRERERGEVLAWARERRRQREAAA